jgi:hypothetical protein
MAQTSIGDIQNLITKKTASGTQKLTGEQAASLVSKYGSAAVSTALAQAATANPNLKIGSNVQDVTGFKIKGEGESRVATYDPSRITRPSGVSVQYQGRGLGYTTPTTAAPFTGAQGGMDWSPSGTGAYVYGGPAGTPFVAATPPPEPEPGPGPTPPPVEPTLSDESEQWRAMADAYMAEINSLRDQFMIGQADTQRMLEEQARQSAIMEQMRIQSANTLAANMARSGQMPNLAIAPAARASQLAGTQPFKYASGPSAPAALMKQPDVLNI